MSSLIAQIQKKIRTHAMMAFGAFFCTVFLFCFHLFFPSMLNGYHAAISTGIVDAWSGRSFLSEVVAYHQELPAFQIRVLTTFLIQGVSTFFSLDLGSAFMLVQFVALWGVFYILGLFSGYYGVKPIWTWLSFLGSFSILFAFFSPIFSYDEALQYLFFFLAMYLMMHKNWICAGITLFFSLLARETGVLLFPSVFILYSEWGKNFFRNTKNWYVALTLLLPTIVFFLARKLFISDALAVQLLQYERMNRFVHYQYNFQNVTFSIESMLMCLVVLAPAFALLYRAWSMRLRDYKKISIAFLIAVLINTPIVFWAARAQEARLFALPLLCVWPIMGYWLKEVYMNSNISYKNFLQIRSFLWYFVYICMCYVIFYWYTPTHTQAWHIGYQIYMCVVIALMIFLLQAQSVTQKKSIK